MRRYASAVSVLALVAGLIGCSGSSTTSPATTGAKGSASVTAGSTSGASTPGKTSSEGGLVVPSNGTTPTPGGQATDPRGVAGRAGTFPVTRASYRFRAASVGVKGRFGPVTTSLKGVYTKATLTSVILRGKEVSGVAIYAVSPAQAASPIFRGQIVTQVVTTLAGTTTARNQTMAGHRVIAAVGAATHSAAAVGWFSGNTVVVLVGMGIDAAQLRAVTIAYLAAK